MGITQKRIENDSLHQELVGKAKNKAAMKTLFRNACIGGAGGFVTIAALSELTNLTSDVLLMASFGGSCVLVFSAWNKPVSQPRNIIGGHVISTFIGLLLYHIAGYSLIMMAAAVGLASMCMILTKTIHPPAGGDPIIVFMSGAAWSYLVFPVSIGSVIIVLLGYIINNLQRDRKYPVYWK